MINNKENINGILVMIKRHLKFQNIMYRIKVVWLWILLPMITYFYKIQLKNKCMIYVYKILSNNSWMVIMELYLHMVKVGQVRHTPC
jgi:hypothetical protein